MNIPIRALVATILTALVFLNTSKLAAADEKPGWADIVLDEQFSDKGKVWETMQDLYQTGKKFGLGAKKPDDVVGMSGFDKAGLTVEEFKKKYGEGKVVISDKGNDKGVTYYVHGSIGFGFKSDEKKFSWLQAPARMFDDGFVAAAKEAKKPKKDEPAKPQVTLTLKEKLTNPIDPKKGVPEISYRKTADFTAKEAAWVVELEVTEDGKAVKYTLTEADKKLAVIPLAGETGSFTGKEGNWQSGVQLALAFSKAKGKGTLRFALLDLKEFQTKDKVTEVGKLSPWLEIPIQFGE